MIISHSHFIEEFSKKADKIVSNDGKQKRGKNVKNCQIYACDIFNEF